MADKIKTKIALANDLSAQWAGSTRKLIKGEVAISYVGDGKAELRFGTTEGDKAYAEAVKLQISADQVVGLNETITSLSTTHYETDDITKLSNDYVNGDTAVEIKTIADDKKSYTAYVYDTSVSAWKAMDGNYRADNVYFDEDITLAGNYTQVGNVKKANTETKTLSAAGKSLEDVMKSIFTQKLQPTKTDPSVVVRLTNAGTYEAGQTVTTGYSAILNPGLYTYGPATGVTASSWEVTDNAGSTAKTTATGEFDSITVTGSTNYTVTAKATYEAGADAKDNMGGTSDPLVKIAAGNKNNTSNAIIGIYPAYYAFTTAPTANPTALTANNGNVTVDGVTYKRLALSADSFSNSTFTTDANWYELFFVIPAGKHATWAGKDSNNVDLAIESKTSATVTFADNTTAAYDVFIVRNAAKYAPTTCTMTFA